MKIRFMRRTGVVLALVAIVGCDDEIVGDASGFLVGLDIVSGASQTAAPGEALPQPIVVRPLRADGDTHQTARVFFSLVEGDGSLRAGGASASGNGATITSGSGETAARWTLGPVEGVQRLRVFVVSVQDTIATEVTATATPR